MDSDTHIINRQSPVPLYFQLAKVLEAEIDAGRVSPGKRFPSEPTICERFNLSRATVRQALAQLERDGLVRREKGRGTFIAELRTTSWHLQSAQGFYEEATRGGHSVTSRVLHRAVEPLPDWAAAALRLPLRSEGVALERVRSVNERPVMYVLSYLPPDLAATVMNADLERGSLYWTLEEREGVTVLGGRRVVEAVNAEDELPALLDVASGAALLFVEAVSWREDGRPFECYRAWHRADRTKIDVQVVHEDVATRAGVNTSTLRIT